MFKTKHKCKKGLLPQKFFAIKDRENMFIAEILCIKMLVPYVFPPYFWVNEIQSNILW